MNDLRFTFDTGGDFMRRTGVWLSDFGGLDNRSRYRSIIQAFFRQKRRGGRVDLEPGNEGAI